MAMSAKKARFAPFLLIFFLSFFGCDQMNVVLSSAGSYQLETLVNNVPLSQNSFITANCEIQPHFTNFDLNDPDITGLVVFLMNHGVEIPGSKVHYFLEHKAQNQDNSIEEDQAIVLVSRLDRDIPFFPIPEDLPAGYYTMVYKVMGGDRVLFQTEVSFFFLADINFSFQDIQMFLPSAAASSRLVPGGAAIMLEARMVFDSGLDPYIIWHDGRTIISEGRYSDGVARIFWEAPRQNSFFSLRAEVFPVRVAQSRLAGISREISLPVSTRVTDTSLVSVDSPGLLHWYLFGGELKDSKSPASTGRNLEPAGEGLSNWLPFGGSYGLAAGPENIYMLPQISFSELEEKEGRFFLRFRPIAEGYIFTARFEPCENSMDNIEMGLSFQNERLFLSLRTPSAVAMESHAVITSDFITAVIDFAILPDRMKTTLSLLENPSQLPASRLHQDEGKYEDGSHEYDEQERNTDINLSLQASLGGDFTVRLGAAADYDLPLMLANQNELFTAIWDEFAIFYKLPN